MEKFYCDETGTLDEIQTAVNNEVGTVMKIDKSKVEFMLNKILELQDELSRP